MEVEKSRNNLSFFFYKIKGVWKVRTAKNRVPQKYAAMMKKNKK